MDLKQNTLDRVIQYFAPGAALRRARERASLEILSAYEGAKTGRRTEGWITAGTDANAAIGPELARLRDRSRDLNRNNPHARRAKSIIVSSAIGTGAIPQADTGFPEVNKAIDAAFQTWLEECDADGQHDLFGLQHMAAGAIFESGETLVRRRIRRTSDGLHVPLQLQVIESDLLDIAATKNNSGGVTIQGVERDAIGRLSGYWLLPQHPGAVGASYRNWRDGVSRFVPASEIAHCYRKERPGQERGVPWLAPVITLLRDLDEYNDAEIVRAKIAACMALFVTQPEGPNGPTLGSTTLEAGTANRIEKLRPGMVLYGQPGQDARAIVPAGHGNFAEYMKLQQHTAAAGSEMFYAQLSGDLSSVNWSSFRAGDRDFRAAIEVFRWLCLEPMLLKPIWRWFIDLAHLSGRIPFVHYGVKWHFPQFMSVDPKKDAEADVAELRSGGLTWPQYVAKRGNDPTKQLEEIREWNQKIDQAGVVLDCDPRKVDGSGKAKEDGDEADPPEEIE